MKLTNREPTREMIDRGQDVLTQDWISYELLPAAAVWQAMHDAAPGGWRPIETALKDGTVVLLATPRGRIADGMYDVRYGVWAWPYVMVDPTHWMPAPLPPEGE